MIDESRPDPPAPPDPLALIASRIRIVPDFPSKGIVFRDITPLVGDWQALSLCTRLLAEPFRSEKIDAVAGIEARGFIFGALVAQAMGVGFVPLRKPGKLPFEARSVSYALEYGESALEAHVDALGSGRRTLLVDDILATGGSAAAACELIESIGGEVVACAFVAELEGLGGRERLGDYRMHSLTQL
ncbi:MAG: adenine phosphoribosyltransferase [Ectothiorhodospiraceae bacterium AqS1]|nr:adenine phosphoribosyltransferase [Ectothiorhodospiraceae bacterium AqS1]